MKNEIGKNIKQVGGFSAFIPGSFPPKGLLRSLPQSILIKATEAERLVGKLDGITLTPPDLEFFLHMFVAKDATSSAQIEGTRATLVDAIEKDAGLATEETDADDILFYIKGLEHGLQRLGEFPLSLRIIKEVHAQVMKGARSSHFPDPGQFRKTQNWIGGTLPSNATFVPPPAEEMQNALGDFEKFINDATLTLPMILIGLAHAQFETIHPFLDGNGRAGRLLIPMLLCHQGLLEKPVLFLSTYFKKHQTTYYSVLDAYHHGKVQQWLEFFLDGVIETANDSIKISKAIRKIRDQDMEKIQKLAKRESESGMLILSKLYGRPIVNTKTVTEWSGFSRAGALKLLERFVNLEILEGREQKGTYDRTYIYRRYFKAFQ